MTVHQFTLTAREAGILTFLAASLDSNKYTAEETKAAIHKCKDLVSLAKANPQDDVTFRIV